MLTKEPEVVEIFLSWSFQSSVNLLFSFYFLVLVCGRLRICRGEGDRISAKWGFAYISIWLVLDKLHNKTCNDRL